jgi:Undecaprenyl-phosphate galactose phosphotransferase WbaP
LSTSQANEARSSFPRTGSTWVTHPVPHLVGPSKAHPKPDVVSESAVTGAATATHRPDSRYDASFQERVAATRPSKNALHEATKRAVDILGTLMITAFLAPLILTIAVVLWVQGGPIIYKHRRIGRDGRTFECMKFRTMVPNAEQVLRNLLEAHPELKVEWVRDHKLRNDPRVTGIGCFLRRTSLDELPQLLNVLRGEMSLVGPRPIVREELLRYGRNVRDYIAAKPGITGLWQVMGRNDTDYRRRVVLDTYYVRNQSLLLDVYILLKTTGVVLRRSGAY